MKVVGDFEQIGERPKHQLNISEHESVFETQNVPSKFHKVLLSAEISLLHLIMIAAVHFDNDAPRQTSEINNEWFYWVLPPKLETAKLSVAQTTPQ